MSRKRDPMQCRKLDCEARAFRGGLCEQHHAEDEARRKERDDALKLLHEGVIDGTRISDLELQEEALRLWDRWRRVCNVVNSGRFTPDLPQDEAEAAAEWCIGIAKQIIEAERAVRGGLAKPYRWPGFWERFENLDKGLMSNGIPRPVRR